jgi:hypothetical protein
MPAPTITKVARVVSTLAAPATAERSIDNDVQAGSLASGPVGS